VLVLHRTRELLVRQRTMLINAIRGHCAEFGIIAPQGARRAPQLGEQIRQTEATELPDLARSALRRLADQLDGLAAEIHGLERRLLAWHRQDQTSQRLATIPGVGIITATALSATSIPQPSDPAASSPPSWAWSHARTPPAAKTDWAGYPKRVTVICGSCWWWAPPR
jgi:transposase